MAGATVGQVVRELPDPLGPRGDDGRPRPTVVHSTVGRSRVEDAPRSGRRGPPGRARRDDGRGRDGSRGRLRRRGVAVRQDGRELVCGGRRGGRTRVTRRTSSPRAARRAATTATAGAPDGRGARTNRCPWRRRPRSAGALPARPRPRGSTPRPPRAGRSRRRGPAASTPRRRPRTGRSTRGPQPRGEQESQRVRVRRPLGGPSARRRPGTSGAADACVRRAAKTDGRRDTRVSRAARGSRGPPELVARQPSSLSSLSSLRDRFVSL